MILVMMVEAEVLFVALINHFVFFEGLPELNLINCFRN